MRVGLLSDTGQQRQLNEDSIMCLQVQSSLPGQRWAAGLFIVADGMGGEAAGEIASEWATRVTGAVFVSLLLPSFRATGAASTTIAFEPERNLVKAVQEANKRLFQTCHAAASNQQMGTTICAAFINGDDLYVASVGDSRCYVIGGEEICRVTKDHSVVQELIDAGRITEEQSRQHPRRNIITRAVGFDASVDVDVHKRKLHAGDSVLLASDGLWGVIPDSEIRSAALGDNDPQEVCVYLVSMANKRGGPDNISVILVRMDKL